MRARTLHLLYNPFTVAFTASSHFPVRPDARRSLPPPPPRYSSSSSLSSSSSSFYLFSDGQQCCGRCNAREQASARARAHARRENKTARPPRVRISRYAASLTARERDRPRAAGWTETKNPGSVGTQEVAAVGPARLPRVALLAMGTNRARRTSRSSFFFFLFSFFLPRPPFPFVRTVNSGRRAYPRATSSPRSPSFI